MAGRGSANLDSRRFGSLSRVGSPDFEHQASGQAMGIDKNGREADERSLTELLNRAVNGCDESKALAYQKVEQTLRAIAQRRFGREKPGNTLQPTIILNDAFLALMNDDVAFVNHEQFFRFASHLMWQTLRDHARKKKAKKRGGNWARLSWDELTERHVQKGAFDPEMLLTMDEALEELEREHPERVEAFRLKILKEMTHSAVGEQFGVSEDTAKRWFRFVQQELRRVLRDVDPAQR